MVEETKELEEVATEEEKTEITAKLEKVDEDLVVEDELSAEQANSLLTELRTGKRFFNVFGIGDFYVVAPSVGVQQEADWESTKVLTRALKDGIPTQEEMEELLKERGLFVDLKEKIDGLNSSLAKWIMELDDYKDKTDKKNQRKALDLAKNIANTREEITELRMQKDQYLSNTAQGKANEARTAYLLSRCVYDAKTNTLVWESFDDYRNENRMNLLTQAMYNFMTFSAGVSANFISEFPEMEVLDKYTLE